ncbi:STAS domain-containing protein [Thermincola ferriacetica]
MSLIVDKKVVEEVTYYKLTGILDISTVVFDDSFCALKDIKELVIDIDEVRFIDSSGINQLAHIIKKCQKQRIPIKIINISNEVFEVLDLIGLPELFGEDIFILKK